MDEASKRKVGRPRKPEPERTGGNLTFRLRNGLRPLLAASARERGHSLSEEVERRLWGSFEAETLEATLRRVLREER